MEVSKESQGPAPSLDLAANPAANQVAYCVMDLQGRTVKTSKESGDWKILFTMLQESAKWVAQSPFKRLSVNFAASRFLVSRDATHVYIVQTKSRWEDESPKGWQSFDEY